MNEYLIPDAEEHGQPGLPRVGGVDAREGVRTPESSGSVAARRGREHGRRCTWAMGGWGAGPW